jgi:hypothetical protein
MARSGLDQMDPFFRRMIGALRLEPAAYEEIEADKKATGEAAFIVVASSLLAGAVASATTGAGGGLIEAIAALIGWALYAQLAYLIGTRAFKGAGTKADWGELARTLGFANTPRFLIVLALIPGLGGIVRTVIGFWVLVATVIALQAALDCSRGRAIFIGIVAWLAQALILVIAYALISGA